MKISHEKFSNKYFYKKLYINTLCLFQLKSTPLFHFKSIPIVLENKGILGGGYLSKMKEKVV